MIMMEEKKEGVEKKERSDLWDEINRMEDGGIKVMV